MAEPGGDYRRGVGIMLLNNRNEVSVGQRADAQGEAWQMPQGGIDEDKNRTKQFSRTEGGDRHRQGADHRQSKAWLRYDLPPALRKRWDNRWRGQQQKWFVMRFEGVDADINVASEQPEFSAWKWIRSSTCRTLLSRSSGSSTSIFCGNYERPEPSRMWADRTPRANRSVERPSHAA